MLVTRIAPTPSGYLHPGNAVNFLLTAWLARQHAGRLLLRIDDMDAARVRQEYLADVFAVLEWLGIGVDEGPGDVAQFRREYSLLHRRHAYWEAIADLRSAGVDIYACRCSRRDLAGHAAGYYPGTCHGADVQWRAGETSLRVSLPRPCRVAVDGRLVDVAGVMGDFVVWRRDDVPAYQLASVVEDRDLRVNAVVRGADLVPSTAAQLVLAPWLGADAFAGADFRHHGLVQGADGAKLSKSAGRQAQSIVGDAALLGSIRRQARELAATVGIEPGD